MSTLKIINGTKPSEGCANYYVFINNHQQGEGLDLEYVDCWGRPMKYTISDDGSNQATIETYVCAKIDTLSTNGGYIQQDTIPCETLKIVNYTIAATANSGDELVVEYIDGYGNTQTESTYAPGGTLGTQIYVNFCAQEGKYTIISKARGIISENKHGPC